MTIIDIWGRVQGGSGGGINTAGCMYQSVIQNVQWNGIANTKSAVLKALYAASPDTLSIKFNVDAYNGIPTAPQFTQGRWVGTIGPYLSLASDVPEPMHVARAATRLESVVTGDEQSVAAEPRAVPGEEQLPLDRPRQRDSDDSIYVEPPTGGRVRGVGPVSVVSIDSQGNATVIQTLFTTAAEFANAYTTAAGIYDVPLTAQEQTTLQSTPAGCRRTAALVTCGVMSPRQAVQAKAGLSVQLPPPSPPSAQRSPSPRTRRATSLRSTSTRCVSPAARLSGCRRRSPAPKSPATRGCRCMRPCSEPPRRIKRRTFRRRSTNTSSRRVRGSVLH